MEPIQPTHREDANRGGLFEMCVKSSNHHQPSSVLDSDREGQTAKEPI